MSAEAPNISWRTYQRLSTRRAAAFNDAKFTPEEDRTAKQQRTLFEARVVDTKRTERLNNLNMAHGKVSTQNGVSFKTHR